MLPIYNQNNFTNLKISNPKNCKNNINFICRLFPERGIGSRDLKNMLRLTNEIAEFNKSSEEKIILNHWGDAEESLINEFTYQSDNSFKSHGFKKDWFTRANGKMVFLSNYEGFGLAPLESAAYGFETYVNEVFPKELFFCNNSIKLIITKKNKISILHQIL